jgi:hypothetical protein
MRHPRRTTTMLDLPDECLRLIFELVPGDLRKYRGVCKRTSELWQRTVKHILWPSRWWGPRRHRAEAKLQEVCAAVQHFSHVTRLTFERADKLQDALPSWYAVPQLASALPKLRSLDIRASDAHSALRAITSSRLCGGLHTRLEELQLGFPDFSRAIGISELDKLSQLQGLSKLGLSCRSIAASSAEAREAAQQLSGLRSLSLAVNDAEEDRPSQEQLAALLAPLAQLTSLTLKGFAAGDLQGQQLAALSCVTQLRELVTDSPLPAALQQQLAALQQLTSLKQESSKECLAAGEPISTLLLCLTNLQRLDLVTHTDGGACVTADEAALVFQHPSLTSLRAGSLACGPEWRGVVLEGSQLQELRLLDASPSDQQPAHDPLANLPTFPRLQQFSVWLPDNVSGHQLLPKHHRYIGIMQLVRRHSSSLTDLTIDVDWDHGEYNEALPAELPRLESLDLRGVGRLALYSLSSCSLPRLTSLVLSSSCELCNELKLGVDLTWLARLTTLTSLELMLGFEDDEELREEFDELLLPRLQGIRDLKLC